MTLNTIQGEDVNSPRHQSNLGTVLICRWQSGDRWCEILHVWRNRRRAG